MKEPEEESKPNPSSEPTVIEITDGAESKSKKPRHSWFLRIAGLGCVGLILIGLLLPGISSCGCTPQSKGENKAQRMAEIEAAMRAVDLTDGTGGQHE